MGRSLSKFDPETSPEQFSNGTSEPVYDEANDLYYEAFVRDGKLHQREYRVDPTGDRIHELTFTADRVIGSGNATRSYLMVHNGYVTEMPLTWYAERETWDMSPGYRQSNPRFSRPMNLECMTCHSSRPEHTAFTQNHYEELPGAISCERCHGPGSAHVDRWNTAEEEPKQSSDSTIVNPADFGRDDRIDVCLQCHLPGVTVFKAEEDPTTFTAGQPLATHRTVFYPKEQIDRPRTFGIDSHPIRLANSACFEQSTMTCTTCHDSHASPEQQTRTEYNEVCKSCHGGSGELPRMITAADTSGLTCSRSGSHASSASVMTGDCVSCHMQQGGTSDIPHIVFTDHWIRRDPPDGLQPDDIQRLEVREEPFTLVRVRDDLTSGHDRSDESQTTPEGLADLEAAVAYFKLYETKHMLQEYLPRVVAKARKGFAAGAELVEARVAMGRALAAMDSLQSAAEVLRTAADEYPENAWVHLWLGDVRLKQGQLQQAVTALTRARDLQPALIEAHVKLATALQRRGESARAVQVLEGVIQRDTVHHPQAYNNLGMLYLKDRNLSGAKPMLQRAVDLDPNFVRARVNLGSLYLMESSLEPAIQQFERAIAVDTTFVPAYGNLGLVYAQQGRRQEARQMFERVLELRPRDQRAQSMLERLRGSN
jgi:predicted CXXCH cytochrome family protein